MSANHVDQRSKGQPNQVSNGGKDVMKVDDSYLQQPQQHPVRPWSDQASDAQYAGHGGPPMSNAGVSDSFFQSYFTPNMSYPFMNQGLGASEGPWSNGADGMFGMGYDYSSVYSGFGFPYSNWEYAGDYWGNSQTVRKDQRGYPSEDAYYPTPEQMIPTEPYGMMNGAPAPTEAQEPIGTVEQGLRNMTLQPNVSSMDSHGRKKMDMGQPPVNVMSDSYSDPSMMMPPPSSSQSVSTSSVLGGSSGGGQGAGSGQPKKTSWAAIASKPAVPQQQLRPRTIPRAPVNPNKAHNMDIGTWDMRGNPGKAPLPVAQQSSQPPVSRQGFGPSAVARRQQQMQQQHQPAGGSAAISTSINANNSSNSSNNTGGSTSSYSNYQGGNTGQGWGVNSSSTTNGEDVSARAAVPAPAAANPVLDKLKTSNEYNPKEFNLNPKSARFFIIKSYSEDDIHRSIKYSIWCSTEHGNKRLDQAFREREGKGPVYLIYSVNGSGHFCGISQMMTPVDYNRSAGVWAQDKWKGQFTVKWVYVKDVPNSCLRHIRLENNENKPVTNSRDTQEVPSEKGKQVLRILHSYKHMTSIFDDFHHYELLQKEIVQQERQPPHRDNHRGGDRGDQRGGDRGDQRGGDRGGDHRGGDRGDHRGGDRSDHRGGDRGDHRGGDRGGDYRGGDRDGGRNRDRRPQN